MEKSRWWGELRVQRLTVDPDFERAVCQHSGFRVGHRICNGDERAGGVGNPAQRNKHSNEAEDCASGWHSKVHVRHVSLLMEPSLFHRLARGGARTTLGVSLRDGWQAASTQSK